jgi:hypothetical protein
MAAATATVKGGFWPQNSVSSLSSIDGRNSLRRKAAMALDGKGQFYWRTLAIALLGAATGGAASKTLARIEANVELGGKRTVETETLINRVTTAGDVTNLTNDLYSFTSKTTFGNSPPVNKDGNPLGTR